MLSKSMLHWLPARTAQADPAREPNVLPANSYNFLDAQASIQDDPTLSKRVGDRAP
jgi:hypothetical protein